MDAAPRTTWRTWSALVLAGVAGVLLDPLGLLYIATAVYTSAVLGLVLRAARRAGIGFRSWRLALLVASTALLIGGLQLFKYGDLAGQPPPAALAATGAQGLLFTLGLGVGRPSRPGRAILLVLGHAAAALGTYSLLAEPGGFTRVAGAAYAGALSVLSLHAYWAHRAARPEGAATLRTWEMPFLGAFAAGALLAAVAPLPQTPDAFLLVLATLKTTLLLSLALLAGPPHLRVRPSGPAEFFAQAIALGLLLNALLLLVVVRWPLVLVPLFLGLTAWLLLAVLFEYLALLVGRRDQRRRDAGEPEGEHRLTAVVAAMNEEATIVRTIEAALALPQIDSCIVVVARRSSDGTLALAREAAQRHAGRVRVLRGTGASKAQDLNVAWVLVKTGLALVLDADEVVEPGSLRHALRILELRPEVGIVQGRKAARQPPATGLQRFIAVERRFSTLFDHTMQSRTFRAAHFAGSAALVRREVPFDTGMWSPATLTEDIEFSVRLHRRTGWRIVYEPRFVVHEEVPSGLASFLRQRARWARGWSQVAAAHLLRLVLQRNLPWRQRVGLAWQLVTSVSAPWSIFFPAILVLWLWGTPFLLPSWAALVLGLVILPSRLATFVVPYFSDPLDRRPATPWEVLRTAAFAYGWVLMGWALQLQALYLELSDAPKVWQATRAPSRSRTPAPAT